MKTEMTKITKRPRDINISGIKIKTNP